jgi:chromosome condensin MukBEF complex kleisin-like MukF subunit
MTWEIFKQKFAQYWFLASSVLLAVIYLLYQRRGRTIEQLRLDAQKQLLAKQLSDIREQARGSQEDFYAAMDKYNQLKKTHSELLARLGLKLNVPGSTDSSGR